MQIVYPDEIQKYIKTFWFNIMIPTDDLPNDLKNKFYETNYLQYLTVLANWNIMIDQDKWTLKERLHGRQFTFLSNEALNEIKFSQNGISLKNPNKYKEMPKGWIVKYNMFINYYKSKGYYLLYEDNHKLNLWQHLLMLLGLKRCYYFYGYDEKDCPSTIPD